MKLGQIKVNCLKLIENTDDTLIYAEYDDGSTTIDEYILDSTHSDILNNSFESINRALSRIQAENKVPCITYEIAKANTSETDEGTGIYQFNLSAISDFRKYYKTYLMDTNYDVSETYPKRFKDTLYLEDITNDKSALKYIIEYYPKVVLSLDDNRKDIPLPDELINLIPYFVKGDLTEDEDASLAIIAKNYFESGLASFYPDEEVQSEVIAVHQIY